MEIMANRKEIALGRIKNITVGSMNLNASQLIGARISDRWRIIAKFAFVGATGAIINLSILWFLTKFGSLYYIFSAIIAIEASIFSNFYLNSKITFDYKFFDRLEIILALFRYHLASLLGILVNISALIVLTEFFGIFYLVSEVVAIFLAFGLNYLISINFVWHRKK
jgi:dolichol-phosphate mannosyltransferase